MLLVRVQKALLEGLPAFLSFTISRQERMNVKDLYNKRLKSTFKPTLNQQNIKPTFRLIYIYIYIYTYI